MKRFTKYFLVKKDYLSNDTRPAFFVQLNYGKPNISNFVSVEANRVLSNNSLRENDKIQKHAAASSGHGTTVYSAPAVQASPYQGPAQTAWSQGPRPPPQGSRPYESFYEKEETLNNESGGDYGGEQVSQQYTEKEQESMNKNISDLISEMNATNARLNNIESVQNQSRQVLDRLNQTPFEQLNDLEAVTRPNVNDQIENSVMQQSAVDPSHLTSYRETKNNDSSFMSTSPLANVTVAPAVSPQRQDLDLADQFASASLALKTPERGISNATTIPITPRNQMSDVIRLGTLRQQSTPRKSRLKLIDSLDQSIIQKPSNVPTFDASKFSHTELNDMSKFNESESFNTTGTNSTNNTTIQPQASINNETNLTKSAEGYTEPIVEGTTLPLNITLPPQIRADQPMQAQLSLTSDNGNQTTIPLTVTLPRQNISAGEEPIANFQPIEVPQNITNMFPAGDSLNGMLHISQAGQNFEFPMEMTVPEQTTTFNAGGVPQSTNIFHLTFYPNEAIQSTKLYDSQTAQPQSNEARADSVQILSEKIVPKQLQNLNRLHQNEQQRKIDLNLDTMTKDKKKRLHSDVSNLEDSKLKTAKVLASSDDTKSRKDRFLDSKTVKFRHPYATQKEKAVLNEQEKRDLKIKRKRGDNSNLEDVKKKNAKIQAIGTKPKVREAWLKERDQRKQDSYMANRSGMLDEINKFAEEKIGKKTP